MSKIEEIRSVTQNYLLELGLNVKLPLEKKVDEIFKRMNFDSLWCAILNFFTCGWYDEHNRRMIEKVLSETENDVPFPAVTGEASSYEKKGSAVVTPYGVRFDVALDY